jgi:hypothetical protein
MIDLRPNVASYARVSYVRELHGELAGATRAMSLAVSAGGGVPENIAYVQTLLGDLEAMRGHTRPARRAYAAALASVPGDVPALFSRAQLDAASGGLQTSDPRLRGHRPPPPAAAVRIALGETQQAAGAAPTPARPSRSLTPSDGCWPPTA